jgi:hypothetical protein
MIKVKVSPNLLSFVTIRRGNWVMKISVFKSKFVLIIGQHYFNDNQFLTRWFTNHEAAANFLEMIAHKDKQDEY